MRYERCIVCAKTCVCWFPVCLCLEVSIVVCYGHVKEVECFILFEFMGEMDTGVL